MFGLFEIAAFVGAVGALVAIKTRVALLSQRTTDFTQVRSLTSFLVGRKIIEKRSGGIEVSGAYAQRQVRLFVAPGHFSLSVDVTQGITFRKESVLAPKDQRVGLAEFDDLVNLPGLSRERLLALLDAGTRAALTRLCLAGVACSDGVAQVSLRGETLPGRDGIVGLIVDILAVVDRFARVGAVRKELSHHATHDVDERFRFECATCLLARGELDDALSQALLSDTAPAIQLMAAEVRKDAVVIERLAVEARGSIATRALTLLIRWDVFHRLNHAQFLAVMPHQEAEWRTLVRQNVGSELDGGHVSLVEDHAGALSKTSNSK